MEPPNDTDRDSDVDISDISETSSSTEDCEDEGDDGGQKSPQNQGFLEAFLVTYCIHENRHDGRRYHLPDYVVGIYYAIKLRKYDIGWEETGEAVAIKAVSWECIRAHQNSRSENFVQEVKALNHLSDELQGRSIEETHVLTDITVMFNISHLYLVMPYCAGPERDLCMRVAASLMDQGPLTEDESRFYFKQMLKGLETLQLMRICHRDLSPEN